MPIIDIIDDVRSAVALAEADADQLVQLIGDLSDDGLPDAATVWELITAEVTAHLDAQRSWPQRTDNDRLDAAFRKLDESGIVARQIFTCCNSCGRAEIGEELRPYDDPYGFVFYHRQDAEGAVDGRGLYLSYDTCDGRDQVEAGRRVAEALRAEGLDVEWDGTPQRRILVRMTWARRRLGRLAAVPAGPLTGPAVPVEVLAGTYRPDDRWPAAVLAGVYLPWLPDGVTLRVGDTVVHREADQLVASDGRRVGRFDGLRLIAGGSDDAPPVEPAFLTARHLDDGELRPYTLAEFLDLLPRLPACDQHFVVTVGRSGAVVQSYPTEEGRMLDTPVPDGSYSLVGTYEQLVQAITVLATEDRSIVPELDGARMTAY